MLNVWRCESLGHAGNVDRDLCSAYWEQMELQLHALPAFAAAHRTD